MRHHHSHPMRLALGFPNDLTLWGWTPNAPRRPNDPTPDSPPKILWLPSMNSLRHIRRHAHPQKTSFRSRLTPS